MDAVFGATLTSTSDGNHLSWNHNHQMEVKEHLSEYMQHIHTHVLYTTCMLLCFVYNYTYMYGMWKVDGVAVIHTHWNKHQSANSQCVGFIISLLY